MKKFESWDRIPLTDDEINMLITNCRDIREQYIITFLSDTGCRVNECIRSKKSWFDYDNGIVWIRQKKADEILHSQLNEEKQKGAKTQFDRFVEITPRLEDISKIYFNEYKDVGRSRVWIYNMIKAVRLLCDIDEEKHVTPHVLRHSYIQKIFDETTLKSKEIGKIVGHCDGTMVENNYTHGDNWDIINKLRRDRNEDK